MLRAGNVLMHALHVAVIVFSCVGWLWPETRPWHLALAACIAASWFIIGPLIGDVGYCVLTGAQHGIWRRLDPAGPRPGYVSYLVQRLTGRNVDPRVVAKCTQAVFYATTFASLTTQLASTGAS
jgi:hypothetical protein